LLGKIKEVVCST